METSRGRHRRSSPVRERRGGSYRKNDRYRQTKHRSRSSNRRRPYSSSSSSYSRSSSSSNSSSSSRSSSKSSLLSDISQKEAKLYLRLSNLSRNVTSDILTDICSHFGQVKSVELVSYPGTKKPKGVAYV